MSVVGIGVDIVSVARVRAMAQRHGERFVARILAESERAAYASAREPERLLAKRFAAKEAFSKAWGTGIRGALTLHAVTVEHDALGKPAYRLAHELAAEMQRRGWRAHLSLSDEQEHVVAFALIETVAVTEPSSSP